jgi:hypothetical protein
MNEEDHVGWVKLKIELPDDVEIRLEKLAQESGLSLKCYCVRILLKHLLKDASVEQKERWQEQFPATLRRNGCDEATTPKG